MRWSPSAVFHITLALVNCTAPLQGYDLHFPHRFHFKELLRKRNVPHDGPPVALDVAGRMTATAPRSIVHM